MKYPWSVAFALVVVGCAVGSNGEATDPTVNAAAPGVDAGKGSSPILPGETGEDDGGTETDANATDSSTRVDAAPDATPSGPCTFTGELVGYDLTKVVGTNDLAATSKGGSVTAAALSRAGVTAVSSSQAMNSSDWPTGAADATKYYVFSVTPPTGCSVKLTSLSIDLKSSGTGPTSASVSTSLDDYASVKTIAVTTAGGVAAIALSGAATSTIQIRVLGFSAGGAAGTMRIQNNVSLTGQVTP